MLEDRYPVQPLLSLDWGIVIIPENNYSLIEESAKIPQQKQLIYWLCTIIHTYVA